MEDALDGDETEGQNQVAEGFHRRRQGMASVYPRAETVASDTGYGLEKYMWEGEACVASKSSQGTRASTSKQGRFIFELRSLPASEQEFGNHQHLSSGEPLKSTG